MCLPESFWRWREQSAFPESNLAFVREFFRRLRFHALLALAVLCGAILIGAAGAVGVRHFQLRQAQQAAITRFGERLIKRCAGPLEARGMLARAPQPVRVIFINGDDETLFEPFNAALSASQQASDARDLSAAACLKISREPVEALRYTDSEHDPRPYTCQRVRRDLHIWLIDPTTGIVTDYGLFAGAEPPPCPDALRWSIEQEGALPAAAAVIDWVYNR